MQCPRDDAMHESATRIHPHTPQESTVIDTGKRTEKERKDTGTGIAVPYVSPRLRYPAMGRLPPLRFPVL